MTVELPFEALQYIADSDSNYTTISIKMKDKGYLYANNNFFNLVGCSPNKLISKDDTAITDNKKLVRIYQDLDDSAISSEKVQTVRECVQPKAYKNLVKVMVGKIFPLYLNSDAPNSVLGIYIPETKILNITPNQIFSLSSEEWQQFLSRRTYYADINGISFSFSRREILCVIELLKGKQAGQIAETFSLKQSSVEYYIQNLKNKCGVVKKNELIDFFIKNEILQQMIV
jgi:DNA-binding CsgD family transcriptional regulator